MVAAAVLLLGAGVAYVTAQRPRIIADDAGVTVRNPLRDHRIGWAGVAEIDLVDLLRVHCAWGGPPGAAPADREHHKIISAWAIQLLAAAPVRRRGQGAPPRPAFRHGFPRSASAAAACPTAPPHRAVSPPPPPRPKRRGSSSCCKRAPPPPAPRPSGPTAPPRSPEPHAAEPSTAPEPAAGDSVTGTTALADRGLDRAAHQHLEPSAPSPALLIPALILLIVVLRLSPAHGLHRAGARLTGLRHVLDPRRPCSSRPSWRRAAPAAPRRSRPGRRPARPSRPGCRCSAPTAARPRRS